MPSRDAQLCPGAELISGVPNSDVLLPQLVALSATHHAAKLITGSARFMGLMGCLVGDGNIHENSSEKKASTTSGTFRLSTAKCDLGVMRRLQQVAPGSAGANNGQLVLRRQSGWRLQ